MSKNVDVDSIWLLSALDKLMSENKGDPTMFCKLFGKKQIIINMIQERKIDGKKYKAIVGKAFKDQNALIKECAVSDTMKLKDPKNEELVNKWFEDIINTTGSLYENQQKLHQKYQSANKSKQSEIKPKQSEIKPSETIKTNEIKIQPKKQEVSQLKKQQVPQPKRQEPPQPKRQELPKPQAKKQQAPKDPPPSKIGQTSKIGGVDSYELVSFKVLDSLLEKNEENKQLYQVFLQKKKQLLDQVSSKALTAEKYKSIISACHSKTQNEDIKFDLQLQIEGIDDMHEGKVDEWFRQLVKQAKETLKDQEAHIGSLIKGKSKVKKEEQEQQLIDAEVQAFKSKMKRGPVDPKEVISLKAIQQQLENQQTSQTNYIIYFQKKKNLLDLYKKGGLTAKKYKDLLVKTQDSVKHDDVKESLESELSQIQDLHNGNIQQWFKDVIESAQMFFEDQQEKVQSFNKGKPQKKKQESSVLPVQEKQVSINLQKKASQKISTKSNSGLNQLFSLKVIDEFLGQNQKNPQVFCQYFQRKLQIFQMMKSGELTPQKYKDLQEKSLKTIKNQKITDAIEMDLADLDDMCNGDLNEWFEELVNTSGENYEDQEKIYNKYKKNKGTEQKQPQSKIEAPQGSYLVKITQKPVINDVICFTAIYKLFVYAVERADLIYYKELELKRTKLIDLVSQKKLIPNKYRDINKASANKTQNDFLKTTILQEESRLKSQFKGNEQSWFESLVGVLKSPPPQLKLPQNKQMKQINSSPPHKKVQYFLRQMAVYECLFYYYKKLKIPISENRYLDEYEKTKRKQIVNCLQIIQHNPKFDVYNLALQMFPPINNDVFYGDNFPALKKRAESYIPLIAKEAASLKDYTSKIKKATNTQNFQTVRKQLAKCEQNMVYLKSWPAGGMVPFPTITEQKIEKYNLDLNTKLDKNDLEVFITSISGLSGQSLMNIYIVNNDKQRHSSMVSNGPLNVRFVAKLQEKQMFQIAKGDKKHLLIRFYKKGFFGGLSLISQGQIQTMFARNNVIEETARIGHIEVKYILKVNKPMRPMITEIMHIQVVQHPKYKHDKYVEEELIKKYIMYSSPTPSELHSVEY